MKHLAAIEKLIIEELKDIGSCDCGFDEQIGEGYQGGTCRLHEALEIISSLRPVREPQTASDAEELALAQVTKKFISSIELSLDDEDELIIQGAMETAWTAAMKWRDAQEFDENAVKLEAMKTIPYGLSMLNKNDIGNQWLNFAVNIARWQFNQSKKESR